VSRPARIHAIVNPKAAGGRTLTDWPAMERDLYDRIGPVETVLTAGPGAATPLTRRALEEGADLILAVGGDGTISEAVNGFFDEEGNRLPSKAEFAFITSGTGGDFRKTFEIGAGWKAGVDALIVAIEGERRRVVDLGRLTYRDAGGAERVRHFVNIASFGLSGKVVSKVNSARYTKAFGGKASFLINSLLAAVFYGPRRVALRLEDAAGETIYDEVLRVGTAAICNGQYFGGGMRMGPQADPGDGLFDIVVLTDTGLLDMLGNTGQIYEGTHIHHPKTLSRRAARVIAEPAPGEHRAVLLDVDGEQPGRLPARFEIVPGGLTLRC